jgi:hypothetical protein
MAVAKDLIEDALHDIGALGEGETLAAEDLAASMRKFRQALAYWNEQGYIVPFRVVELFDLSIAKMEYTWGPGGDFDSPSPTSIDMLSIYVGQMPVPLQPRGLAEMMAWQPTVDSGIPTQYVFDRQTVPVVIFNRSPFEVERIRTVSRKPLAELTDAEDVIEIPASHELFVRYNLAEHLSSTFEKPVPQLVAAWARKTATTLYGRNMEVPQLQNSWQFGRPRGRSNPPWVV